MSEHTPGPWGIIELPSLQYRIDAKQGHLHVCPAIANSLPDAWLVAAAPALLAALKAMIIASQDDNWGRSMAGELPAARAAVARAEGVS